MNQPQSDHSPASIDLVKLHQTMDNAFDDGELRHLCFELEVEYEKDLPPGNTRIKMQELVAFMERHRRLPELVTKVKELRPHLTTDSFYSNSGADDSPYKGMYYFDTADADNFFGREALTARLVAHLRQHRFLAVVGASGSGKSSVVRAGLIPALQRRLPLADGTQPPEGSRQWPIHIITPGAKPLESLAVSLTKSSESLKATPDLIDSLGSDARSLHLFVRRQVETNKNSLRLLIVVDQFEELFTLCRDEAERQAFVDNLVYAASQEAAGPTLVVLTIRADFYSHCLAYPQLQVLLEQKQKIVDRMLAEELREAIEAPARRAGLKLEAGLVDLLLRDVGKEPGALPLLSHALLETWKRREGKQLTLAGYQAAGGVHGAIAKTADETFNSLSPDQQTIARTIFLRLTEPGEGAQDTRRRATTTELIPQGESRTIVEAVLKTLTDARLVTTESNSVEVAHEALIREWPRLREWVAEGREGLRIHRQLTEAAQAWLANKQDEGYLYRGGRLVQTQEWRNQNASPLNELEHQFLTTSEETIKREEAERENQQRRELEAARQLAQAETERANLQQRTTKRFTRLTWILGIIVTLALGVTVFAFWLLRIAQARDLATQARIAYGNQDFTLAALLATQSDKLFATAENRQFLGTIPYSGLGLGRYLQGYSWDIASVAWSADGRLASGAGDNTVVIWDLQAGQPAQTLQGHSWGVTSVAWSADGRLASGAGDNTVVIWDLQAGHPAQTLQGHSWGVTSVAWSADGRLVSGSEDNTVIIWDLQTEQPAQRLQGHSDDVTSVAWSADGRLVSGSEDNTVIIWDLQTEQPAQRLWGHSNDVTSVTWSANGRLASGSVDGTVIIWDLQTGQPAQRLWGHSNDVTSVTWSANGRLASGSADGAVIIWDLQTGQPAQTLWGHSNDVTSVTWSRDGRLTSASWDNSIIIWDLQIGQPVQTLQGHSGGVTSVAWSGDGRLASGSWDNTVIIWDLQTGQPVQTLQGHSGGVTSVAWSGDGHLASGSWDNTVIIWDLQTGQPVQTLQGHSGGVNSVAWSGNGRLASGSWDNTVIIWDLQTGQPAQTLQGHSNLVTSIAWSGDGRLASGSWDNTVIIWDLQTGQPAQTLQGHSGIITSVAWSGDGRLASASWDNTVIIWDLQTEQPAQTLQGHSSIVTSVAWSGDGRLASGSWGGTVIVWDLQTGQPAQILQGHSDRVNSVAWSRDDPLVSGSSDGIIKVLAEAFTHPSCHWLLRNFSEDEWVQYMGNWWVYEPVCPNLPQPPIYEPLLTWQGRFQYGATFLPWIGLYGLVAWAGWKLLQWGWWKLRPKKPSPPVP